MSNKLPARVNFNPHHNLIKEKISVEDDRPTVIQNRIEGYFASRNNDGWSFEVLKPYPKNITSSAVIDPIQNETVARLIDPSGNKSRLVECSYAVDWCVKHPGWNWEYDFEPQKGYEDNV